MNDLIGEYINAARKVPQLEEEADSALAVAQEAQKTRDEAVADRESQSVYDAVQSWAIAADAAERAQGELELVKKRRDNAEKAIMAYLRLPS